MELLGGYGSEGSCDSGTGEDEHSIAMHAHPNSTAARTLPAAPPSLLGAPPREATRTAAGGADAVTTGGEVTTASVGARRKVVDYSKLPVSRPLPAADDASAGVAEPPLKKAATELEGAGAAALLKFGQGLVASLPPPRGVLGSDTSESGALRIDISSINARPRDKAKANVQPAVKVLLHGAEVERAPDVEEDEELPECLLSHPMFSDSAASGAGGDGPSLEEMEKLRSTKFITTVAADDLRDPNWYMNNQISGGPGLHSGKKVAVEVSAYDASKWQTTTHKDPSRIQKRKHQINWLAQEAMEKEAEMLDRAASSRLTKSQTSMKYGW